MRQILRTASIFLSAAGSASAQVVAPVPASAPLPPAAPVVRIPAQAPIVAWTPHQVNVDLDLTSLKDHAKWAAGAATWEDHAFNFTQVVSQPFQKGTQSESLLSQARSYIDRNQYDRALSPLDRVIAAKAERTDAAMYWKAYTLYKLARRDEAVTTVNQLQKEFPQSPWVRDARALEVEIKQSAGQAVGTDAMDDDVKLLALQGIMRTDPEAAFPYIEKMLAGAGNVRLKENALFVLSQNRSERARNIIAGVARGNANPDLQRSAIRLLAQSNSPDAIATLSTLYRADQSMEIKRTIISSLSQSHNNTAAHNALITIARTERDSDLKLQVVRHLSNCRAAECKQFMLEILDKK